MTALGSPIAKLHPFPTNGYSEEQGGDDDEDNFLAPRASTSSSATRSLDLPSLQPLSHDHPLLSAPAGEWNADVFLLSRLHIPLEELRGELRGYLGNLREELTQLINEDYEEFISLGTGLRGEEQRLRGLEEPLKGVRNEVQGVRDVLAEHQGKVQSKLDERSALREEKALLDLLQRLFETLARAEALLDPPFTSDSTTSETPNNLVPNLLGPSYTEETDRSKLVIRVAGEYTQLVYLLNKARGEGCAIVDTVSERIEKIKHRISQDLATLLTAEMAEPAVPKLKHCLKTYELIEGWEEAEEVVRRSVREFCDGSITTAALVPPTSPTVPDTPHPFANPFNKSLRLSAPPGEAGPSPLVGLYNRILAQVEDYQPLLQISEDISEHYDFFSRVIWPEISTALVDKLGGVIFAAGRPDELHKHYTLTHSFISILESMSPSPRSVLAMRSSPSYVSFERRWQLPVYFQLRWKEVVGNLEAALTPSAIPGDKATTGKEDGDWALPQSSAAWKALRTCWSEEVYIPELASRFWRLSLQIVARYGTYLKGTMDSFAIGEEESAQEDAALRFAASAIIDLNTLSKETAELEVVKSLGLEEHVTVPTNYYAEKILLILTRRCVDPLKLVRSVASQFRAASTPTSSSTSKPSPSYFVPSVLKPLHALFNSRPALREPYGKEWSTTIVDSVFQNYGSILSSVRKTEDLLRRHRKSKKSGFSSFFGSSTIGSNTPGEGEEKEEERFKVQMKVDIEALRDDAASLGVEVDDLESWKELVDIVNRPAE